MKRCPKCSETKEESDFSRNRARKDGLQRICRICQSAYVRQHYLRNTSYYLEKARRRNRAQATELTRLIADLKNVPCADCGARFPTCVMDFDHVRGVKVGYIHRLRGWAEQRLWDEIEKCEVVCSNCHRLRTQSGLQAGKP